MRRKGMSGIQSGQQTGKKNASHISGWHSGHVNPEGLSSAAIS